jgi:hypothetical protein
MLLQVCTVRQFVACTLSQTKHHHASATAPQADSHTAACLPHHAAARAPQLRCTAQAEVTQKGHVMGVKGAHQCCTKNTYIMRESCHAPPQHTQAVTMSCHDPQYHHRWSTGLDNRPHTVLCTPPPDTFIPKKLTPAGQCTHLHTRRRAHADNEANLGCTSGTPCTQKPLVLVKTHSGRWACP